MDLTDDEVSRIAATLDRVRELRPENYRILGQMAEIMVAKSQDYCGKANSDLSNLMMSQRIGVPAWKGALIRLMDKWSRIENFACSEELAVKDESFEDTLLDNAIYSLLIIRLWRLRNEFKGNH